MPTAPRPPRPQHDLQVRRTQRLGPHLVRLVLTGESLAGFTDNGCTDAYVKLRFTDADGDPVTRTYTVRAIDREARELTIDFVTHGDTGLAAPWAANAQPGDPITLTGPGGGYAPDPTAWHLFVADMAAVPAVAAALESLPADARGAAYLEVESADDVLDLAAPEGVEIEWIVDATPDPERLAKHAAARTWPADVQVFAHGEREAMKAVRRLLRERDVPRESISISGYWARGRTEQVFQAEKRTPIGKID